MYPELKITEDGSHTLYLPELAEHYHSVHGAIQESMHVFIKAGLEIIDKRPISVFEVGMGTGLNVLLSAFWAISADVMLSYHTCEPYPLPAAIYRQLNYPGRLNKTEASDIFQKIHESPFGEEIPIHPNFILLKTDEEIQSCDLQPSSYDLVFFDAFAPEVQPELWNEPVFQKLAVAMKPGGVLVTYSAKGQVRRNLKAAGLTVERLPGPPGKREMIRARKAG
jgi:tRNA U34 5-methylaminomethyl-2-thiouridine-forming methyltransferase MnmC